jgi:hypothetical protein
MQGGHLTLTVLPDNLGLDDQWNPVVTRRFPRFESKHGETTWKTRHTAKDGLESFGEMVGNEILEDLDGCYP